MRLGNTAKEHFHPRKKYQIIIPNINKLLIFILYIVLIVQKIAQNANCLYKVSLVFKRANRGSAMVIITHKTEQRGQWKIWNPTSGVHSCCVWSEGVLQLRGLPVEAPADRGGHRTHRQSLVGNWCNEGISPKISYKLQFHHSDHKSCRAGAGLSWKSFRKKVSVYWCWIYLSTYSVSAKQSLLSVDLQTPALVSQH